MNLVCPRCHSMVQDKEEYNRCGKCGAFISHRLPPLDEVKHMEEETYQAQPVDLTMPPKKGRKKREPPTLDESVQCTRGT